MKKTYLLLSLSIFLNLNFAFAQDLDWTFGSGGFAQFPSSNYFITEDVLQQNDGKIIIERLNPNINIANDNCLIYRFHIDGTLDNTFGDNGKVYFHDCEDFILLDNDKFLVLGDGYFYQLTEDGQFDTNFGTNGQAHLSFDATQYSNSDFTKLYKVDDNNVIITGKYAHNGYLQRYSIDGNLDTTFNNGDVYVFDAFGLTSNSFEILFYMFLPNGEIKIIINSDLNMYESTMLHVRSDLTLDTTLGQSGLTHLIINCYDFWNLNHQNFIIHTSGSDYQPNPGFNHWGSIFSAEGDTLSGVFYAFTPPDSIYQGILHANSYDGDKALMIIPNMGLTSTTSNSLHIDMNFGQNGYYNNPNFPNMYFVYQQVDGMILVTNETQMMRLNPNISTSTSLIEKSLDIEIFPNPLIGDELNIKYALEYSQDIQIDIFNLNGQCLQNTILKDQTSGKHLETLQLKYDLPSGIYILKIRTDHKVISRRFFKQ